LAARDAIHGVPKDDLNAVAIDGRRQILDAVAVHGGARADSLGEAANFPSIPASDLPPARHQPHVVGDCVSSASVFSPFTAANATFAVNAGLWFRRGRLLILPLSGGQHGAVRSAIHLFPLPESPSHLPS